MSFRIRFLSFLILISTVACSGPGCSRSKLEPPRAVSEHLDARHLDALRQPNRVVLYSLFPFQRAMDPAAWEKRGLGEQTFHDYAVYGEVELDEQERAAAIGAIFAGIDASDGTAALCFNPRHGLRVERNGALVEFVICYECMQIRIHDAASGYKGTILTATDAASHLTRILRDHGIPISDV